MSSSGSTRVFCHGCSRNREATINASDNLECTSCNSSFVEMVDESSGGLGMGFGGGDIGTLYDDMLGAHMVAMQQQLGAQQQQGHASSVNGASMPAAEASPSAGGSAGASLEGGRIRSAAAAAGGTPSPNPNPPHHPQPRIFVHRAQLGPGGLTGGGGGGGGGAADDEFLAQMLTGMILDPQGFARVTGGRLGTLTREDAGVGSVGNPIPNSNPNEDANPTPNPNPDPNPNTRGANMSSMIRALTTHALQQVVEGMRQQQQQPQGSNPNPLNLNPNPSPEYIAMGGGWGGNLAAAVLGADVNAQQPQGVAAGGAVPQPNPDPNPNLNPMGHMLAVSPFNLGA